MKNSVRFFGPLGRKSGYGSAVKNFALAFSKSGINTKFHFPNDVKKSNADIMKVLKDYGGKTNIDFYLHCPPWTTHRSLAKYKIAYFYWEADKLPVSWNRAINTVDEIWAPCNLVKKACINAKFRGKIRVVPTPNDKWNHSERIIIPSQISDDYIISDSVFKFYSVFQWHERKGFRELLNAYYKTFAKNDRVMLILKVNPLILKGSHQNKSNDVKKIKSDISIIKRKLNQKYYPPVLLVPNIVPVKTIEAIHNTCDCYVTAHHGEGWGMPIHDAMLAGNHIITTKFGGITESLDEGSAHIIKHKVGPVTNMGWSPLYNKHQSWAYPSISHLGRLMRDVYINHDRYIERTNTAKEIVESFTTDKAAEMINRNISRLNIRNN